MQVVVIGVNSWYVSIPLLQALIEDQFYEKIGQPIIALTRSASKVPVSSDRIKYVEWQSATDLDPIFAKADLVINTTGPRSDWDGITDAVIRAKSSIKAYIPSEFGSDAQHFAIQPIPQGFQRKLHLAKLVRDAGIKVIEVQCGGIDGEEGRLRSGFAVIAGLDPEANTVQFVGNMDTEYHATWNHDLGRAVASIVAFHQNDFSAVPDVVNIFSYAVTAHKVINRYIRQTHSDPEFLPHVPYEEALALATMQSKAGERSFGAFVLILRVLMASGPNKGLFFTNDHREFVNPGEKYFKWHSFTS